MSSHLSLPIALKRWINSLLNIGWYSTPQQVAQTFHNTQAQFNIQSPQKMQLNELSEKVDVSIVNLSNLKTGKVKAIRFSTLNGICKALDCQPGDILEYIEDEEDSQEF